MIGAALLLGGCAGPGVEKVYVELPVVPLLAAPASNLGAPSVPTSIAPSDWTLPALEATGSQTGDATSEGVTALRIKNILEKNRVRLYHQLLARLLADYHRKADALRAKQIASFEMLRSAALDQAYAKVSAEYRKYANSKGPLVVKVAILAGFPDPDPKSLRTPSASDPAATRRFEAAKVVRTDISKLDSQFASYATQALKESNEMTDAQIADLVAEMERNLAKSEEDTRRLAAQEYGRTQKEIRPLLADQKPMTLPATSAVSAHFPAASPQMPVVNPPSVDPALAQEPQKTLEAELRVWLRVNRYVLVRKGAGRDATREFLSWRKTFNPQAP